MNPLNLLMSINALLLLAGLLILGVNVVFSAIRLRSGHTRAGVLGVLTTLFACALITVGLVRATFPALGGATLPGVAGLAAPGTSDESAAPQAGAPAQPGPSGQQSGGSNSTLPAPLQTAMASGRIPAPVMTQIAQGTLPSRQFGGGNRPGGNAGGGNAGGGSGGGNANASGTPEAGGNAGGNGTSGRPNHGNGDNNANGTPAVGGVGGGNAGGDNGNAGGGAGGGNGNAAGGNAGGDNGGADGGAGGGHGGNGNAAGGNANGGTGGTRFGGGGNAGGNFAAAQSAAQATQIYAAALVVGALLIGVAGILLYRREQERDTFEASWSPGLLYIGAGVFVLVAALVIPALPGQFFVARAAGGAGGRFAATSNGPLPTRVAAQTSTPTATPVPSGTPTALPSLTPAPSQSPTPLFTAIAYANTDTAVSTTVVCTLAAQTTINLRGDPSVQQQGIGRVFAGALLSATGRTADKKWWRAISTNDTSPVEGWVSADFVKVVSGCADDTVPVVGPTLTPSRTPRPSRTPVPSRTPKPSATPRQTATTAPAAATQPSASPTSSPTAATASDQSAMTSCTVMTTVSISLRPDPSRTQPPLAQIPEGTALTATSKSADGSWWRVTYAAADGNKDGWIGNAGVFPASACASLPAVTVTPSS